MLARSELHYCHPFTASLTSYAAQIFDDDSATIGNPHEIKQWLPADHLNMCKFDARASVAYKRVSGAIVESIEDALRRASGLAMSLFLSHSHSDHT